MAIATANSRAMPMCASPLQWSASSAVIVAVTMLGTLSVLIAHLGGLPRQSLAGWPGLHPGGEGVQRRLLVGDDDLGEPDHMEVAHLSDAPMAVRPLDRADPRGGPVAHHGDGRCLRRHRRGLAFVGTAKSMGWAPTVL